VNSSKRAAVDMNPHALARPTTAADMRIEGRYLTLVTDHGTRIPSAVCGLCSAVVAIHDEGELRRLLFHADTGAISGPQAP
jgi:hypothetical protein